MGKNILIAGASGMVGGEILDICLSDNEIQTINCLVRKPESIKADKKINEIIVADFNDYSNVVEILKNIDVVFYCVGVYTGSVSEIEFRQITVDYPVNLAKAVKAVNTNTVFCLLSGQGADRTEKSRIMFARDKGVAENLLSGIGFKSFYAFRPGYIYPSKRRKEPNITYKIFRIVYPFIKLLGNNWSVTSRQLAKTMFAVAMIGSTKKILENKDIVLWPGG